TRIAHYLCELAELAHREGQPDRVRALLDEALQRAPTLARAWMARSSLRAQQGDATGALDDLLALAEQAPASLPLAARTMAELAQQTGRIDPVLRTLGAAQSRTPSIDITEALARLATQPDGARSIYLRHLE